ncbi:MAG: hypothetical protein UV71_C0003G0035 [Microgenomates group bacterium GW2011_GWC1_43_13]|uniref:Uncharacterized protein n=3 Tax=Candidatus Woeseibacteriota TaxID=1752722 RepID=A0A837I9V0_9BACT|nr:MAG: hypothetical protein UV71_C0003G0035 [Microgenomates group bacterium GW2011_GWC1_43_13]KKT33417.1 MAG: hypothetical protein UW20_C0002G0008 [Candidatus Woesebacteria bacterium GW2011_GWB1_44_11]KKT54842.1 MAG: hypothetical protein UW47_C0002G0026 [Candidatus Woesebacteria bacterium GW2011_GWA1_44_23]OGM76003.1 MAG: hypothetical protein A2208_02910 [Candidatus Woesebacteria bacterium RIFOXYA1_FULL_43_16]OGM81961.1 MAG: hypothetical protein A2394_03075 [Candidatus Woesebacteria bacterium 
MVKNYKDLVKKVEGVTKTGKVDLSSSEDLSIAIMNLISIEEHLFFTAQKTEKPQYLDILNEVRGMRTGLLRKIIKDYEGEVWCISKHLLAASMRLMEVGTKEEKKGNRKEAWELFQKSFRLYSLFWAINLKVVDIGDVPMDNGDINFIGEKEVKLKGTSSPLDKLTEIFKKAVDCCKE